MTRWQFASADRRMIVRAIFCTLHASRNLCYLRTMHYGRNMRIIRIHGYGYEFVDKAIAENYNKSAVNVYQRALVITSWPKRSLFTLAPNVIHNARGDNEQFVIYPNVIRN